MIDTEIPKYIKKLNSSTSQSRAKSKHKHRYQECLLIDSRRPYRAKYCTICGKIYDVKMFEFENGYIVPNNKILQKYRHLKQFKVDSPSQKYIN
jgi:hypothetical protein